MKKKHISFNDGNKTIKIDAKITTYVGNHNGFNVKINEFNNDTKEEQTFKCRILELDIDKAIDIAYVRFVKTHT